MNEWILEADETESALLSDRAYQLIKHKIATLQFPPSSLINEQELMEELGIGRTPIREALRRLEVENLVTIVPRRGTFVSELSITDLQALAEIRQELEGLAARLAAERIDEGEITQMEALFEGFEQAVTREGNEVLMDRDKRFHHLLYRATRNKFLEDILDQLYTLSLRLWYFSLERLSPEAMQAAMKDHLQVIEALKEGDADRAEQAMQRHVERFQKQMKAVL